ncbi:hypothetical protein PRIPAC_74326 [Pristionchus pacificus]|nr:hypothetical protein PRIPAC_74326 [Pristionchus pacificus]
MADRPTPRTERLRLESLLLSANHVEKIPDQPSTSGHSERQCPLHSSHSLTGQRGRESAGNEESEGLQPVILDADRLAISPVPPTDEEGSPFQDCQADGLLRIFEYLTLKERIRLSQTCQRFYTLLTDKKHSFIRGLTVVNMFQRRIWDGSVRNNVISSLTMIKISSIDHLVSLLKHVKKIDSLKIWYYDTDFVDEVLDAFDDSIAVRNIDVYPYSNEIALTKVAEVFPRVQVITMRPHGNYNFFNGIQIASMPNFAHLSILSMDSFEPMPGFAFPSSIKSLDFAHRKLADMRNLFAALEQLNLSYLSLSHLKFNVDTPVEEFVLMISRMKQLDNLVMKFCHFSETKDLYLRSDERKPSGKNNGKEKDEKSLSKDLTVSLRSLHFDLCYDVDWMAMFVFTECSRRTLKNLSVSLLYEDEPHFTSVLKLSPLLHSRGATIAFSVMQKDTLRLDDIPPPPELPEEFRLIVTRFEASYLLKPNLLASMFGKSCKNLQECKFVMTRGLTDSVLNLMSFNCPHLKKLSIISCSEATEEGLLPFATNIVHRRTSSPLKILYKNNGSLITVYGELSQNATSEHSIHYYTKTFTEADSMGECLYFKDQSLNRTVIFKNYTPEDSNHLLGLVIDIWQYREWLGLFSKFSIDDELKATEVANDTDAVAQ